MRGFTTELDQQVVDVWEEKTVGEVDKQAHASAIAGRGGQQRRRGIAVLEVLVDDPRLADGDVAVIEERHLVVRVQREERRLELLAREEIDLYHLVVEVLSARASRTQTVQMLFR